MLPSRVNPSQGTGASPPLLLPSKAFPAADEKCSIPDGQKFWWPVLWWLYESGVQYFLGSNSQSQFLASIFYMNWHLPGIFNFLLQQDLAKWEPLATKGLLATLAIWLMSTMVPVPHKIDAFKLYIVDSQLRFFLPIKKAIMFGIKFSFVFMTGWQKILLFHKS